MFLPLRTLASLLLLPLLFAQAAHGDINSKLLKAAKAGDTAKVERLLKKDADLDAKDKDGLTALMWAAGMSKEGGTALMWAAGMGHTDVVKTLIDAGADVTSALMFAAMAGHTETVKALLDADADVNAKNQHGWTALLWAAVEGHTETAKVLIDAGADVNTKDKEYGATALIQ
jgi:ankyrin repeat protein